MTTLNSPAHFGAPSLSEYRSQRQDKNSRDTLPSVIAFVRNSISIKYSRRLPNEDDRLAIQGPDRKVIVLIHLRSQHRSSQVRSRTCS